MKNETAVTDTNKNLTEFQNFCVRVTVAFLEGFVRTALGLPARRY